MSPRQFSNKTIASVAALVFFATCSYIGRKNLLDCFTDSPVPEFCRGEPFGLSLFPQPRLFPGASTRFEEIFQSEMQDFQSHPGLKALMTEVAAQTRTSAEARAKGQELGQELVRKGISRLPPQDLDEWNRIRLLLAQGSDAVCAALWSGRLDQDLLVPALSSLPEPDSRAWFRFSSRAGILELESVSPIPADSTAVIEGLDVIAQTLAPPDRQHFLQTLDKGVDVPPADGCAAVRTLMIGAQQLQPALRARFLRALASGQ